MSARPLPRSSCSPKPLRRQTVSGIVAVAVVRFGQPTTVDLAATDRPSLPSVDAALAVSRSAGRFGYAVLYRPTQSGPLAAVVIPLSRRSCPRWLGLLTEQMRVFVGFELKSR